MEIAYICCIISLKIAKMKNSFLFVSILTVAFLTNCAPTGYISTTSGCKFDENKNQTHYFVLPLGTVFLPGKWEKTAYNKAANQQFFLNKDSIGIAIGFTRSDGYEFNRKGLKKR
jgi:hypothetical protein